MREQRRHTLFRSIIELWLHKWYYFHFVMYAIIQKKQLRKKYHLPKARHQRKTPLNPAAGLQKERGLPYPCKM